MVVVITVDKTGPLLPAVLLEVPKTVLLAPELAVYGLVSDEEAVGLPPVTEAGIDAD